MKIGWFTDTFAPQRNGVVTSLERFGEELTDRGHEVHVYSPSSNGEKHKGMHVHEMPSMTFPFYQEFDFGVPLPFKTTELDIVHTHSPFNFGWYGLTAAKKQDIPKVTTFHTLIREYVDYLSSRARRALIKTTEKYYKMHYRYYDKIITPSKAVQGNLPEIDVDKNVIPTGINTEFFQPTEPGKDIPKGEKTYLYLGRLGQEKKIDQVIEASEEFLDSEDKLLIVGKGPEEEKLKKKARKTSVTDQINFEGFVDKEKLPEYYSAADLFITASDTETQGLVLTEAMACGTPVLAADAYALPEVVEKGENGDLFTSGDTEELAKKARKMEKTDETSKAARKTSEEYSIEKTTDKLEELYRELI